MDTSLGKTPAVPAVDLPSEATDVGYGPNPAAYDGVYVANQNFG